MIIYKPNIGKQAQTESLENLQQKYRKVCSNVLIRAKETFLKMTCRAAAETSLLPSSEHYSDIKWCFLPLLQVTPEEAQDSWENQFTFSFRKCSHANWWEKRPSQLGTSQTEPRGSNMHVCFLQEREVQKGRGGSGVFNGHSIASVSHVVWRSAPRLEARVWCSRWHHQLQHSPNCPPQDQGQQQTSWWVNLITLPEEFLTSRLWCSGLISKM